MSLRLCSFVLLLLSIVSHVGYSAVAPRDSLAVQVRVIQPNDLIGTFQRIGMKPGSDCPRTIEHTRFVQSGAGLAIPHTAIKHDGNACTGDGSLSQLSSDEILNLPEYQFLRNGSSALATAFEKGIQELAKREVFVGLARSERKCSTSVSFPPRTMVGMNDVDDKVPRQLLRSGIKVEKGDRLMSIWKLQGRSHEFVCVYHAQKAQDSACFPAEAMIQLKDGIERPISDLQLSDTVHVGDGKYSEVFMFTHRLADVAHEFVRLTTRAGALTATPGHYVYINDKLTAAGAARVGDTLTRADGTPAEIIRVQKVWATGLYNPQTLQGDIVVDGFRASTYTTAVEPTLADALLTPLRGLHRLGFKLDTISKLFDRGVRGALAEWVPKGLKQYS